MRTIRKIAAALQKPLLTAFIAVFVVGGVALAQTSFTQPASAPPGGNVSAPVNVGAAFQQKVGQLWAKSMGTDDGYCIGDSCITAWPTNPIASCQMCVSVVWDGNNPSDNARGQCGGTVGGIPVGGGVSCVPVDQWTAPYRDDGDDRRGGCQMQWKLDCAAPYGDTPAPQPSTYNGSGNDETISGGGSGGSGGSDTLNASE